MDAGKIVVAGSGDDVRAQYSTPGQVASLTDVLAAVNNRRTGSEALAQLGKSDR